ncbi:hypothetical protein [Roseateles sp.]|jgi:hypothetical protein|uniref:hypothetical protein n=1 Tax=Roseateles sp. TaxID=1971397 RepID=UPI0037CA9FA4
MNTTVNALVLAVVIGTSLVALGLGLAAPKAAQATEVVKLKRVVIEGRRMQTSVEVAQLPQVVITGRRAAQSELQMAAAKLAKAI